VSLAKTDEPIEMPFEAGSFGLKKPCVGLLDAWGRDPSDRLNGNGHFWGSANSLPVGCKVRTDYR